MSRLKEKFINNIPWHQPLEPEFDESEPIDYHDPSKEEDYGNGCDGCKAKK